MKWLKKEVVDFPLKLNVSYRVAQKILKINHSQIYRQVTGKVIMSEKAAKKLLVLIEKKGLRKQSKSNKTLK